MNGLALSVGVRISISISIGVLLMNAHFIRIVVRVDLHTVVTVIIEVEVAAYRSRMHRLV